ncbi:hypothetical protein PKB_0744 [Pseudomonas knackmussii B13]|uniref:Sulfate transporter n=1 Tax=Pseudomonas knackmussii (strain DSM 6978 / CCUG 54928 / LMG 23759 / B13) TaxID=1301098 RepID=A0A024HC98_PSEKB|nr:DUF3164 family protein [Pseudomonas knackmussii]CDF82112.1 hypothetical protein PKB_0744 [Pseudomonas knackmussii B13]
MTEKQQTPSIHIPAGFVMNAAGHLVPEHQVREHDKLRDQVACDLVDEAVMLHNALASFKARALADIADLIRISGEKYGVTLGGEKGNVSIFTYDGQYKIERNYADRVTFTDEVLAAKELIDVCIRKWSADANPHLRVLVDRAFSAGRNGQIKTSDILGLLRLEIDDSDWKTAMVALKDAIQVNGKAVYIRVYKRVGSTGRYEPINLNIAVV